MRILRNYLLKEFFTPFILSFCVLSFLMVMVGMLKDIVDQIINRGVELYSVLKLLLLMTPYIITYTIPIALLMAVLISLGRLSSDNEIIAIRASGINLLHLIIPLLVSSVILSLGLFIFNDRAASYAHFAYRKTLIEIGIKNPTAAFEEGVFINSFERYVLFIYHIDRKANRMNNIRIYEPQGEDKPTRTIVAKAGEFIAIPEKNLVKLKLIDGTSDEPDPQNPNNFYKLNFKTYFMTLNLDEAKNKSVIEKKPKEMTIKELKKEIRKLKHTKIDAAPLIVEIHQKIVLAVSCFVFMLLGLPLAMIARRREKSINIGIGILIIIAYYPLLIGCEALGMQGCLNPALATWLPNMLFGIIGVTLIYKLCAS
ncbi:MAG: LptF/LptG family permease [Candidatus Omnitrophica bacterium]|nr:LptF/LptG family permease [Candidatus Omnitrophota bacterium]